MSARYGIRPWLITGTVIGLLIVLTVWPAWWPYAAMFAAGALVAGLGNALDRRTPTPEDADLTADEARALATDLGLQLYRAEDAIAYVAECCDIADRQGQPVTTARVRTWLRGAQCARQTGLVLPPDVLNPEEPQP